MQRSRWANCSDLKALQNECHYILRWGDFLWWSWKLSILLSHYRRDEAVSIQMHDTSSVQGLNLNEQVSKLRTKFQIRRCLRKTTWEVELETISGVDRRWYKVHRVHHEYGVETEKQKHWLDSKQEISTWRRQGETIRAVHQRKSTPKSF